MFLHHIDQVAVESIFGCLVEGRDDVDGVLQRGRVFYDTVPVLEAPFQEVRLLNLVGDELLLEGVLA